MRRLLLAATLPAMLVAVPAAAQDSTATQVPSDQSTSTAPQAPDGSRAFGIEPYIGIMGGWEQFDSEPNRAGIPQGSATTS